MEIAREVCPGYVLDEEMKPLVANIFDWCLGAGGKYDPDKGLWLWGEVGTGKSTMLRIVRRFCQEYRHPADYGRGGVELPYWYRIHRATDICDSYAREGAASFDRYVNDAKMAIDDLGTEARVTGHYGTPANVIAEVLLRRYDVRQWGFTHVTTNLSPAQIAEVYGIRVYDRCGEMFNFINMGGYSHRPEIPNQ